jgi:hypothetical protein
MLVKKSAKARKPTSANNSKTSKGGKPAKTNKPPVRRAPTRDCIYLYRLLAYDLVCE